jgi:hypothetical protein
MVSRWFPFPLLQCPVVWTESACANSLPRCFGVAWPGGIRAHHAEHPRHHPVHSSAIHHRASRHLSGEGAAPPEPAHDFCHCVRRHAVAPQSDGKQVSSIHSVADVKRGTTSYAGGLHRGYGVFLGDAHIAQYEWHRHQRPCVRRRLLPDHQGTAPTALSATPAPAAHI